MATDHVTVTSTCGRGQVLRREQFQTTPCLRLHDCSQQDDDSVSLSVRPYLFGAGVIISTPTTSSTNCDSNSCERRVTVDILHTADVTLSRLAVVLLNNSQFLTSYYSITERRQVHHYIQPTSSLHELRQVIARSTNTSSDVVNYADGVTLTVSQLSQHDVHVSVINDVAVLHVRLVTSQRRQMTPS